MLMRDYIVIALLVSGLAVTTIFMRAEVERAEAERVAAVARMHEAERVFMERALRDAEKMEALIKFTFPSSSYNILGGLGGYSLDQIDLEVPYPVSQKP